MDSDTPEHLSAWRSPLVSCPELLPGRGAVSSSAGLIALLTGLLVLGALSFTVTASAWRMAAQAGLGLLVVCTLLSLRLGGWIPALRCLLIGAWLLVTAALAGSGLASLHVAAYPLLLFMAGCLLGGATSVLLYALSCVVVLLLTLEPGAGPQVSVQAVTLLLVMGSTVLVTLLLVRVFLVEYGSLRRRHSQNQIKLQMTQAREADLRRLTEHIPGLIFECDAQGRCIYLNQRLARFFGKPPQVLLGTPMLELLGGGTVRDFSSYQAMVLRGDVAEFEMRRLAPDGVWCHVEVTLVPRQAADGTRIVGWYGMVYDVTRRDHVLRDLRDKATHDVLTGLPNRMLFHERLDHALQSAHRRQKSVAVMFIDLDNFKRINDVMGHATGDLLLCEVARRITGAIRSVDTVARLGGDEFVVLAEEVENHETAALIADKVLEALLQPVTLAKETVSSGASIGIAMGPQDGATGEALLQAADAALYEAKAAGRKCYRLFGASGPATLSPAPETGGFSRSVPL